MEKTVAFCLLILCEFVSQGFSTASKENENSSDLYIRKKRVIGHSTHNLEAPFLVSVISQGLNRCPATILTQSVVLTSAQCLKDKEPREWRIKGFSIYHQVQRVISYRNYNALHPTTNNLALAFVHPPINFHDNRPISIYSGNLAASHEFPCAFNWKHVNTVWQKIQSNTHLEKVVLRLISYEYCHNYYRNTIGVGNICTQSTVANHFCQNMDTGAPLVVDNQLLGIFAFRGNSCQTDPDVFMNLLDHDIRRWIHEHVPVLRLF